MVLKYYSHDKEIMQVDLSKEKIIGWETNYMDLGYEPKGCLVIQFDERYSKNPLTDTGGLHPPVDQIINYEEVLNYLILNSNFQKLHIGSEKPILRSRPRQIQ